MIKIIIEGRILYFPPLLVTDENTHFQIFIVKFHLICLIQYSGIIK